MLLMACRFSLRLRNPNVHDLKLHRFRIFCTVSNKPFKETVAANSPSEEKNTGPGHILHRRIKNELSYALPTVPLPPKLAEAVKEVLKCERSIRVFC